MRKKIIAALAMIAVFLAVMIPIASTNPDGLEKVVSAFGAEEQSNFWNGLFSDYSLPAIGNQYISTLVAGVIGVILVLSAGLVLGKVMASKSKKQ